MASGLPHELFTSNLTEPTQSKEQPGNDTLAVPLAPHFFPAVDSVSALSGRFEISGIHHTGPST